MILFRMNEPRKHMAHTVDDEERSRERLVRLAYHRVSRLIEVGLVPEKYKSKGWKLDEEARNSLLQDPVCTLLANNDPLVTDGEAKQAWTAYAISLLKIGGWLPSEIVDMTRHFARERSLATGETPIELLAAGSVEQRLVRFMGVDPMSPTHNVLLSQCKTHELPNMETDYNFILWKIAGAHVPWHTLLE